MGWHVPAPLYPGCAGDSGRRWAQQRSAPSCAGTWYAKPAKVADNLYFLGTKIDSAWAIHGSEGIIIIEALFDYASKDEILDCMKKVGLDQARVKDVLLSHAHAAHDGGTKLLRDAFVSL